MKPFSRFAAILLLLGIALPAGATGALDLQVQHDEEFEFDDLETFGWMPAEKLPARARFPENDAIIREEVEIALVAKGFVRATAPDFLIIYYVGIQEQVSLTREESGETRATPYEEGTLILEFYALGRKLPIWRGEANDALDRDHVRKQVRKIVGKLIKRFPPS
jgi:hypothetical protein